MYPSLLIIYTLFFSFSPRSTTYTGTSSSGNTLSIYRLILSSPITRLQIFKQSLYPLHPSLPHVSATYADSSLCSFFSFFFFLFFLLFTLPLLASVTSFVPVSVICPNTLAFHPSPCLVYLPASQLYIKSLSPFSSDLAPVPVFCIHTLHSILDSSNSHKLTTNCYTYVGVTRVKVFLLF